MESTSKDFLCFSRVTLKLVTSVSEWNARICVRARVHATCIYGICTSVEREIGVETAPCMLTWAKAWLSRQWSIAWLLPRKTHPCIQGVKRGEKEKSEERGGGERMKEKPEDSQLSTLSDDNIIVGATYTSRLLYQELFPLDFTQNENKRWQNSQ